MNLSPFAALALALTLALLVIFAIDPLDPSTFSTPFCLGIILMWFSLRHKAWSVLLIAVCYCILDFYATDWFMGRGPGPLPHPYFWFFQRFGLFFVVSVMAVYLSYHREESDKNIKHIETILSKLPVPVVISDAAGYISYANEALCLYFGQPGDQIVGKRYLEFFMTDIEEGKATRHYIELFAEQNGHAPETDLMTRNHSTAIKASQTCLGKGSHRTMITVLQSTK